MKGKFLIILFFGIVIFIQRSPGQTGFPDAELPTDSPRLFAKGILTDGLSNRDFTISPEGDEIFFTLQHPGFVTSTILYIKKENGRWTRPAVAPFSGIYRDLEASFSPDGKTIYFSSDRPVYRGTEKKDFDLWRVDRIAKGKYGEPKNLGNVVNTDKDEFYPSVAKSGNLYFTAEVDYGKGKEDIVVCKLSDTGFQKPESLPEDINTKNSEFNAFIDPDEQFIIFGSFGREDEFGNGDLYISHKNQQGEWQHAKHLPAPVNSNGLDYCPYVTKDKKYFIFTSNRPSRELSKKDIKTYDELRALLSSPGNGLDDIYWMKFNKDW